VLDRVCTPEICGPALTGPLRELFTDLDGPRLAEYLVGGVLKADLRPRRAKSLKWDMLRADDFLLPPLPNHLFTRDNSCWVYGGVSMNPMAKPPGSGKACTSAPCTVTIPCSPAPTSSGTTAMTTPATSRPASKAAMCTSWATARS
jgi:Arginine deiminase